MVNKAKLFCHIFFCFLPHSIHFFFFLKSCCYILKPVFKSENCLPYHFNTNFTCLTKTLCKPTERFKTEKLVCWKQETKLYLTNIWTASSEFGTYRLCERRRFRRACASAQSRQNLRCSLIQAVNQEEPSDRNPDPWPLWMAGHAQL